MKRALLSAMLLLGLTALPHVASGSTIFTATGTGANTGLSASAEFDIVGGRLQVIVTNTGKTSLVPADVLTGVFWDGITGLTPYSAYLTTGYTGTQTIPDATFVGNTAACSPVGCGSGNVGGEFAYAYYALSGGGFESGISSSGLGIFGNYNFNGSNLNDPDAVNGLNFGLVTSIAGANSGVTKEPLIQSSVTFLLDYSNGFSLTQIANVRFQYGTALDEPNIGPGTTGPGSGTSPLSPVPEPASMLLLGTGLAFVGSRMRRGGRKQQKH